MLRSRLQRAPADLFQLLRDGQWPEFLERLADEYGDGTTKALLGFHDFGQGKGTILEAANIEPRFAKSYPRYSKGNPWVRIWRKPQGSFVLGADIPQDRTWTEPPFVDFMHKWLLPQNVFRSMGAILFRTEGSRACVVAIALLRPMGPPSIGDYTEEEQDRFKLLIPAMEQAVLEHPFVRRLLPRKAIEGDVPNKPAKQGRMKKRKRNPILDEYRDYLAAKGLSDIAAEAAASGLQDFLAEKQITLGTEHPPEPVTTPASPASTAQAEADTDLSSSSPPLPTEPPARWPVDRLPKESAPEFIKRIYQPWLGKGLRRSDIARLDRPLYNALRNWLLRHDQTMPEDVPLPSQKEQTSALVDTVFKGDTVTVTISHPDPAERVKAFRRLGEALRYHEKKGSEGASR